MILNLYLCGRLAEVSSHELHQVTKRIVFSIVFSVVHFRGVLFITLVDVNIAEHNVYTDNATKERSCSDIEEKEKNSFYQLFMFLLLTVKPSPHRTGGIRLGTLCLLHNKVCLEYCG